MRLFIVPDGVVNGKDGQRLVPGLHAIAIGDLGLSRGHRMIGEFGCRCSFLQQLCQGTLMQDVPPRRTQLSVDHVSE